MHGGWYWDWWMFVMDGLSLVISDALRLYLLGWQFAPIFLIGSTCTSTHLTKKQPHKTQPTYVFHLKKTKLLKLGGICKIFLDKIKNNMLFKNNIVWHNNCLKYLMHFNTVLKFSSTFLSSFSYVHPLSLFRQPIFLIGAAAGANLSHPGNISTEKKLCLYVTNLRLTYP